MNYFLNQLLYLQYLQMIWIDLKKKEGNEKIRPIKKTLYDRLINYIAKPIRKSLGGFKDKSLFKINTPN